MVVYRRVWFCIRFALFTIRPLLMLARFELQRGTDALKEGFSAGFLIVSSLFNKLKKEIFEDLF